MSNRMSQREFSESLDKRLSGLQEVPWLEAKVLAKAEGEKPVKKKLSAATIVIVVLLILAMAGAVAAALNSWGVVDFAGNRAWTYVPENAQESISREEQTFETDALKCTVQESYYDGKILRATFRIEPKEKTLLIHSGDDFEDPFSDERDETIAQYAQEHFDGNMTEVWIYVLTDSDNGGSDCSHNEDGSIILYIEECLKEEHPELTEIPLELGYAPVTDGEPTVKKVPMTLKVHAVESELYVCEEPLDFPEAGVQVTRAALTVTPLEIRVELDYTVTDLEKYNATEDGLWFEFVNPKSTATDYFGQTFESGMAGGGSVACLDDRENEPGEDEEEFIQPAKLGSRYRQTDTLGLNALSDEYTLRAYNCWEKNRYETVSFRVKKVK